MGSKHTPGPWRLDASELTSSWVIVGAGDVAVASLHMEGPTSGGPIHREEVIGNRSLIAAAPAMLEALEGLAYGQFNGTDDMAIFAREAIEKLEGRKPDPKSVRSMCAANGCSEERNLDRMGFCPKHT